MSARRTLRRAFEPFRRPPSPRGALAIGGLAVAAIVLQNAPSGALPPPTPPNTPPTTEATATRAPFAAGALHGHLALAEGALLAHGERTLMAELQVSARGEGRVAEAPPSAVVLVLDTSGSMAGEKIDQARRAVLRVVDRMGERDLFGLVTYASGAHVVAPLAPVGGRRAALRAQILGLMPGGGTQIPSGLRAGHALLQNARHGDFTRRLVLVSDGIDGSGTGPAGAAALVRPWAVSGVTVASLGIGVDYQESYLTAVADAGRGAYAFLATGSELEGFLTAELEAASKTVVESAVAELRLPPGARLVRLAR
ncbi:MAG: VWA domain-containing protein, partial [Myxococcota bacterium]